MNVDYDPFEGWEVTGKPRIVLSPRRRRSTPTARSSPSPASGRFVKRSLFDG